VTNNIVKSEVNCTHYNGIFDAYKLFHYSEVQLYSQKNPIKITYCGNELKAFWLFFYSGECICKLCECFSVESFFFPHTIWKTCLGCSVKERSSALRFLQEKCANLLTMRQFYGLIICPKRNHFPCFKAENKPGEANWAIFGHSRKIW